MSVVAGAMLHASAPLRGQCGDYDVSIVAGPDCGGLGSPMLARGINENGQVAGHYTLCSIGNSEAFVWDGGPDLTTLGRPPQVSGAAAFDINDAGLIAGTMSVDFLGDRAFIHDGTRFIDLGLPPGAIQAFGRGINNNGDVVGKWGTGVHAFLYRDGVMIDLMPDLGTPAGEALDVNDQGQITGWMGTALLQNGQAYIWDDGRVMALGHLANSSFTAGRAINDLGHVVGQALIGAFPNGMSRPFLWDGGRMRNLGVLPGFEHCAASDINDDGEIVGTCSGVDGNSSIGAAFIWQDGVMTDLNDLISPGAGVEVTWATAINNQGQITGKGDATNGDIVAVLLTPVQPRAGDVDGDCRVGTSDLLALISLWGPCPDPCAPPCLGDLDGDCAVGVSDLLTLLANWS